MLDLASDSESLSLGLGAIVFVETLVVLPMIAWLFIRSRWRIRRERAIAWFWDTRIPMLLDCVQDDGRRKRWVDETKHSSRDIARDAILEFLVATAGSYRDRICLAYGELGFLDADLADLRSPIRSARLRALRRLTLVASEGEREAIRSVVDPTWAVRVLRTQILARIGTAEDVHDNLMEWKVTSRLHEHALKVVLETIPIQEFRRILLVWNAFPDPAVRRDLLAVGAVRAPALTESLLAGAAIDDSEEVRMGACQAAARLLGDTSVPLLLRLLEDTAWEVRAQAAKGLAMFGDPDAVADLGRHLSDASFWVRQNAASSLGTHGPPGHDFLISTAVMGRDRFARDAAAAELNRSSLMLERRRRGR